MMFARNVTAQKCVYYEPLAVSGPRGIFRSDQIPAMKEIPQAECFKNQLLRMDPPSIQAADKNPYEYLIHLLGYFSKLSIQKSRTARKSSILTGMLMITNLKQLIECRPEFKILQRK